MYLSSELTKTNINEIYKSELKSIKSKLKELMNGGDTHYSFLPEHAYLKNGIMAKGFVIDHQELDYLTLADVDCICSGDMDIQSKKLTDDQKNKYNHRFFLTDGVGFSIVYGTLQSPWIEYLMQRFSNTFIRIGVDNPNTNDIDGIMDSVFKQE